MRPSVRQRAEAASRVERYDCDVITRFMPPIITDNGKSVNLFCAAFCLVRKWLGPELHRRHADFQSAALLTELPNRHQDFQCRCGAAIVAGGTGRALEWLG